VRPLTVLCCTLFLGAALSANLVVSHFGQAALPFTAFVLIPFDMVTRDVLHEQWKGPRLLTRMVALIAAGSLLTFVAAPGAGPVALASFLAFAASGTVNALVYASLPRASRLWRMNVSNACAAVVDSVVFPFVAFATVDPALCGAQAASKFLGGLFWSVLFIVIILRHVRDHETS
jgi:queuosine precursor transporter